MRLLAPLAALSTAALSLLGLGIVPPSASAADAPATPSPQAAKSPLTAEEREFFSWWDTLGYPDVTKLPFVKLWTPYRHHFAASNDEDATWPEGAFLVSESGPKFTVFRTDLSTDSLETVEPAPKDERRERIAFERGDLAKYVEEGFTKYERADPKAAWFSKPDPFDAHRWSSPNQAFRIAVLARACAGRGLDDLAHRLIDRALHEQTRPFMTQQWGEDDPTPRAALDSIRGGISSEARDQFMRSISDASLAWGDLLARAERLERNFGKGATFLTVAGLRAMAEEDQRLREHPPKPLESLSPDKKDERIERLIHDLRDVGTYDHDWRRRREEGKQPPDAVEQLKTIGFAAVPALLDALDDDRPTRSTRGSFTGHAQYRDSEWPVVVGSIAWEILDHLSGGTLEKTPHGGPPTSGQPTRRQIAERWFAAVGSRGEVAVLSEQVRKGEWESREAAERLAKIDALTAIEALEAGVRAAESGVRSNLVYGLEQIDRPEATEALARLLPLLHGSDAGVRAASTLDRRGRPEGLADLVRAWKEREDEVPGPNSTRFVMGSFGSGDLEYALAATNEMAAIRALGDGLGRRPAGVRISVAGTFLPGHHGVPSFEPRPGRETASGEVERAVEELLATLLEDTERDEGLTIGESGAGMSPVVGEIAAWVLAVRHPDRHAFDPDAPPHEREAQRIAMANVWRKAHGKPPLEVPARRPAPKPLEFEPLRADFERAATSADASARATAVAALGAKGLPAVPALRRAVQALASDAPGRADLDALVRRLALVVADVEIAGDASLAGSVFKEALEAAKGKRLAGAAWWDLYAKFATSAPRGAATRLVLAAERDGAERGVLLKATLEKTKPGIGTQDEGDVSFEHPTIRRNDESHRGGSGSSPISVFARPGDFAEYEAKFDETLAAAGPDDVVTVRGEVTVHR